MGGRVGGLSVVVEVLPATTVLTDGPFLATHLLVIALQVLLLLCLEYAWAAALLFVCVYRLAALLVFSLRVAASPLTK